MLIIQVIYKNHKDKITSQGCVPIGNKEISFEDWVQDRIIKTNGFYTFEEGESIFIPFHRILEVCHVK